MPEHAAELAADPAARRLAAHFRLQLRAGKFRLRLDLLTDPRGAAFCLGCSERSLRRRRAQNDGPPWVGPPHRPEYPIDSLARWMIEHERSEAATRGHSRPNSRAAK